MLQSKPTLIQTSNFGGSQGTPFNDIQTISNWPSGFTIDTSNPIAKIELWSGWVIDAITVTYRLADGSWKAVKHGANVAPFRVIELGPDEIITNVCGWAGMHTHYKKELLITISFGIFDTKKGTLRIAGPFGGDGGTSQGKVFHVTGPIAFAGFETNGPSCGMSGISVIKSTLFE